MLIGFDAKRAFHNRRGLGHYARTLIHGFLTFYPEHDYCLFTPGLASNPSLAKTTPMESAAPKDLISQSLFPQIAPYQNARVVTPNQVLSKLFSSPWRLFFQEAAIRHHKISLFHGLSHELPANVADVPMVVTVHDLIHLRYPALFPWVDRHVYTVKLRHAMARATHVVAICQQTKQDLQTFLDVPAEKITVVYQSCNPIFQRHSTPDTDDQWRVHYGGSSYMLYVGAFEKRKNVCTLVSAFAQSKCDLDLVLIGRGSKAYTRELAATIAKHDLGSRVRILGDIPTAMMPIFYRNAKFSVYPSTFEGFGIPIIESLFCQTPVITSTGSVFPESAGPGALFVEAGDDRALSDAIRKLASDDALCAQLAKDGHAYVQRFAFQNVVADMMALYRQLV